MRDTLAVHTHGTCSRWSPGHVARPRPVLAASSHALMRRSAGSTARATGGFPARIGLVGWEDQETACLRGPRRPYSARSYSRSILLRNNDAGMHAANIQSRSGTRTYRAALCGAWCIATHPASHCLLLHRKFVPTIISTEEIDWRPCHDRIIST